MSGDERARKRSKTRASSSFASPLARKSLSFDDDTANDDAVARARGDERARDAWTLALNAIAPRFDDASEEEDERETEQNAWKDARERERTSWKPLTTSPTPATRATSPPEPPRKLALGQGMRRGYTPSRGDQKYDASERVWCDEFPSPSVVGACALIPSALDAALGIAFVDADGLVDALASLRSRSSDLLDVKLIDCRFPFAYDAGRVCGATNAYTPRDAQRVLTRESGVDAGARVAVVFYCARGEDESLRMWRHIRNLDRRSHVVDYPALSFPLMYVLRGGFDAFYDAHPEWCQGSKITLNDTSYDIARREYAAMSRECWFRANAATSIAGVDSFDDSPLATTRARFDRSRRDVMDDD